MPGVEKYRRRGSCQSKELNDALVVEGAGTEVTAPGVDIDGLANDAGISAGEAEDSVGIGGDVFGADRDVGIRDVGGKHIPLAEVAPLLPSNDVAAEP